MVEGSGACWFGAPGFVVVDVADDGFELVVEVETSATVVGCELCGSRARAKDRRWVTLRDAPAGGRPVRVRWRKRIWACPEPDCEVKTWTEHAVLAAPRRVLTRRAEVWACERVAAIEATPASLARGFGVSWATVWSTVARLARERVDDPVRVGATGMVGFDETVMQPAHRRRRRRFVTGQRPAEWWGFEGDPRCGSVAGLELGGDRLGIVALGVELGHRCFGEVAAI